MALQDEFRDQGNFLFKHRSYLPVIIILVGLAVFIFGKIQNTEPSASMHSYSAFLFLAIGLFGLIIRSVAVGYSGDNTSGRNTTDGQIADSINTTGLYALCRHPLYVGNFFMWLGIACFTENFWFIIAFVFFYWLYYERIMYAEESYLISKYKDSYLEYAAHTPVFVPTFKLWVKPQNTFSWKKIIRQEKSGLLYLFMVILIFEIIGNLVNDLPILENNQFWIVAFFIMLLWYISVKIVQKSTNYLATDR
ncbi:DUF1295 domain-containing protein [Cryomorpha ignava]|uniref:DUF1295 domain-containing protein n=1 Tax=Cryomorpha ignava TaxID=101383 RepID=A0A7K3WKV5_9FLAO|nr:isoprenylcysteine carboxylmethyltransferase family protein [Cryomorpha ignava]NEN22283.1 DUF1295 domain-containing protein [Cryomorpha ignava]